MEMKMTIEKLLGDFSQRCEIDFGPELLYKWDEDCWVEKTEGKIKLSSEEMPQVLSTVWDCRLDDGGVFLTEGFERVGENAYFMRWSFHRLV
jgi:hypothetical protein